ncbi:hypothetical protein P4607_22945 [Priestia megaterium]|uniref:hypothetical protein n=1 Tax=Priestia megaterium TaxID=1404 RepID=UPI002E20BEE4|nr:hypothetical protein [Priestia megaterium]
MASNKTPNLNLDIWAEMDYFKRAELNTNFSTLDSSMAVVLGTGIYPEQFPKANPNEDDTQRFQAAVSKAISTGLMKIRFSTPEIKIASTVNIPTGLSLVGLGFDSRGLTSVGTVIKRTANVVALKAAGASVTTGDTGQIRHITFEGIKFNGGNYAEDFLQLIATSSSRFTDCTFTSFGGRAILMHETMDSRFNDCNFEWGGTTDGTVPMLELRSGSGYEYTNQIHFSGCRWESYRGTALATTGSNTNELFFTNCKFESLASNVPHLKLYGTNTIHFGGVNICSKGTGNNGTNLSSQIEIDSSAGIQGSLYLEHTGTIGTASTNANKIDKFVDIKNSSDIDLYVYVYQNGNNIEQSSVVMIDDASNDRHISVRGSIKNSTFTKTICNKNQKLRNSTIRTNNPVLQFKKEGRPDNWDLARMVDDGVGTKFQMIHGDGTTETTVFDIANSNDFNFRTNVFFNSFATHIAQLSAAPYGREGSQYLDKSVTPNATRTYANGNWRRMGYFAYTGSASLVNLSGSFNTNDIYINTDNTEYGTAGSKYFIYGIKRLTPGANNVLNTDWREMRMLTGN